MPTILNHNSAGDDGNAPLPPPNWERIDAVAATLGLPPYLRLLPPADGGAR